VPGYEADYDPNQDATRSKEGTDDARRDYDRPPEGEPIFEEDEERYGQAGRQEQQEPPPPPPPTPLQQVLARDPNSGLPYDAQREREELMTRNKAAKGWKGSLKRGLEMAAMGGVGSG
jgi:hypothetical protein